MFYSTNLIGFLVIRLINLPAYSLQPLIVLKQNWNFVIQGGVLEDEYLRFYLNKLLGQSVP